LSPFTTYGSNLFHISILKEWIDRAQVNILYVFHVLSRYTILTDVLIPCIKSSTVDWYEVALSHLKKLTYIPVKAKIMFIFPFVALVGVCPCPSSF